MNPRFFAVVLSVSALCSAADYDANDFAADVISYSGVLGVPPYDDPNAVLGKPTTWITGKDYGGLTFACSLVFPAYNVSPDGHKLILTLGVDANIVVGFDHNVGDDPANPYGIDFIIFGNSAFVGSGVVDANTDMDAYRLISPASVNDEPMIVSVAQDPDGPWYSFEDGPYADDIFPTNAFAWNSQTNNWASEQNWLRPVDPNLSLSDFSGLAAAEAIELYDGSAGGTGFDIAKLSPEDYAALDVDPQTGRKWIRYIRVQVIDANFAAGEIDAFADVAGCGDYKHPYPTGDIDKNCRVDFSDFALLTEHWLQCTWDCD
jgi:hypothetical protein